jgi:hypothetical protein
MIPVTLIALGHVLKQTQRAARAKRAVEEEVLRIVIGDAHARIIIAQAARSGTEPVQEAKRLVYEGAEALSSYHAKPVMEALSQGEHQGSASYVRDIARQVNRRLPKNPSSSQRSKPATDIPINA